MLPDRPDRRLRSHDVPFAPAAGPAPAGPGLATRAAGLTQRWRVPLGLLVGSLVVAAGYFAWQVQQGADGTDAARSVSSKDDPLVAAVAGLKRPSGPVATTAPPLTVIPTDPASTEADPAVDPAVDDPTAAPSTARAGSRTTGAGGGTGQGAGGPAGASTTSSPGTGSAPPATAAPKPVYIGDQVTFDDWDGPGAGGVTVTLQADANRDGKGEATRATTVSSPSGGTYHFDTDPGCYVVVFSVPSGQSVLKGSASNPVCLAAGESNARIDLVISRPVKPPASCTVLVGNGRQAGVQVAPDSGGAFAPSYALYDSGGKLIRSTAGMNADLGSSFPRATGWSALRNNYDERAVVSVAAEDGKGGTSSRVTCSRRNA